MKNTFARTLATPGASVRRFPVLDIVLALLGLLLAGLYATFIVDHGPGWPHVVNVILHVGLSLALLIRRTRVRASFIATYLLLGGLELLSWVSPLALGVSPALLCAPLSLWTVTRRDPQQRWGITALILAIAGSFASPLRGWGSAMLSLQVMGFVGVYLVAAYLRRAEVAHATKLESGAVLAAAAERARIARELHDIVGHSLTVVGVQARTGLAIGTPEQLRASLESISLASSDALAEVRALVYVLRDDEDERTPTGNLAQVHDFITSTRASGVDLDVDLPDALTLARWQAMWPSQLRLTVLRVVQESLTNVVKHGGKSPHATLAVGIQGGSVHLQVSNDRTVSSSSPGYGLIGLRERVALSGGTIEAGPRQGGFQVRVCLPLPETLEERL